MRCLLSATWGTLVYHRALVDSDLPTFGMAVVRLAGSAAVTAGPGGTQGAYR